MMTECAFFNHAPHTRRNFRRQVAIQAFAFGKIAIPPVKVPGFIRARGLAVPASYAASIDLADNSGVMIQSCGGGNTHRNARWLVMPSAVFFAMHARPGKIADFSMRKFFAVRNFK
jgi:hypothetical protein